MRIFGNIFSIFRFNKHHLYHSARGRHGLRSTVLFNPRPTKSNTNSISTKPQSRAITNKATTKAEGTSKDPLLTTVTNNNISNSIVNNNGNILPVALISSKNSNTTSNLKILVIPINLFKGSEQDLRNTFQYLEAIRKNENLIDTFSESVFPSTSQVKETSVQPAILHSALADSIAKSTIESKKNQKHHELPLWQNALSKFEAGHDDVIGLYNTSAGTMITENDLKKQIDLEDTNDAMEWNRAKKKLMASVPDNLRDKLQQMAITSMQLAFEMNMTNIKDAILMGSKIKEMEMLNQPKSPGLNDPILSLTTCVNLDPPVDTTTVPLNFNALIQGTIRVDATRFSLDRLCNLHVPYFNDDMTAIAANICSTALQKGFPTDISRMYSTNSSSMLSDGKSSDNAGLQAQSLLKQPKKEMSRSAGSMLTTLIDDKTIRGLMSCNLYAKALAEASKRREAMKGACKTKRMKPLAKCKPCGAAAKKAPAPKCESKKAKSKCPGDPCKKFKKEDPCKKKKDPCGQKDPCKKKEDPCKKKKDPCQKKKDPCKKKEDPCKKKKDPCQKKKDPCKKKEDPCKKKKDPCAKKKPKCGQPKKKCSATKTVCSAKKSRMSRADYSAKWLDKKKCKSNSSMKCAKKATLKPACKPKRPSVKCGKKKPACKPKRSASACGQKKSTCNSSDSSSAAKKIGCKPKSSKSSCAEKKPACKPKRPSVKCGKKKPACKPKPSACAEKKPACKPKKPACKPKKAACKPKKPACKPKKPACKPKRPSVKCGKKKPACKPKPPVCKPKKPACKPKKAACGKKKSPCASKASDSRCKPSASNSSLSKSNPQKKNFSTTTLLSTFDDFLPQRRTAATIAHVLWRRAFTASMSSLRYFSSKKGKKKDQSADRGKCAQASSKIPGKRWTLRYKRRQICEDPSECPKKLCKDPRKTACRKAKKGKCPKTKPKKENKKSIIPNFTQIRPIKLPSLLNRQYFVPNQLQQQIRKYSTESDYEDSDVTKYCNEVIKIVDCCTVKKVTEIVPNFSDYDVLVRTEAVALSGSDIHVYETGGRECPSMTLGHDASGVIEKVGRCVQTLRPGDRVAVESALSCGICEFCKRGEYNMCTQLFYNGFLSKYQIHPADLCHKLPDCISAEEGALVQTLALGCQACQHAQITPTTNVLVIGSCATAVSAALCARAFGAQHVCLCCKFNRTLDFINRCFNFDTITYDDIDNINDTLERIVCELTDWPKIVINCSVSEFTMNLGVMALQPCGTCILAGCENECACFNAIDLLMKNLKIFCSFRSANMFPMAIYLMETGYAPMGRFIAQTYRWGRVEKAFRAAQCEANIGNRKVIVKCADDTFRRDR